MQAETSEAPRDGIELACFPLGEVTLAVDAQQVREVARCPQITPLPKAPSLIEGVIDLRGRVIPVVDLGRALLDLPLSDDPLARVAILECEGLVFGLRVGSAAEVITLPVTALEEPPTLATHAGYDAVRAVVRREGAAPALVISVEHLLERIYRSARSGEES
ncbi:MAG TPA: chemotaxis protein CheW [Myxococcota bacterium]|jgi:purine-binding chemotaxis protein CheW